MSRHAARAALGASDDDAVATSRQVPSPHSTNINADLRVGRHWVFPITHPGGAQSLVCVAPGTRRIKICDIDQWVCRCPTLRFRFSEASVARLRAAAPRAEMSLVVAARDSPAVTLTLAVNHADTPAAEHAHVVRAVLALGEQACDRIVFALNRHVL
jgi:hypothetical protein